MARGVRRAERVDVGPRRAGTERLEAGLRDQRHRRVAHEPVVLGDGAGRR
jgi:hypothetical protein